MEGGEKEMLFTFCKNSKIKLIACVITFFTRGPPAPLPAPPPGPPRYDILLF
jgi:hypothetical protein